MRIPGIYDAAALFALSFLFHLLYFLNVRPSANRGGTTWVASTPKNGIKIEPKLYNIDETFVLR